MIKIFHLTNRFIVCAVVDLCKVQRQLLFSKSMIYGEYIAHSDYQLWNIDFDVTNWNESFYTRHCKMGKASETL